MLSLKTCKYAICMHTTYSFLMRFSSYLSYSLGKLKPKTKTKEQNIFFLVYLNENLKTFLYTSNGGLGQENKKGKKFSCPLYSRCMKKSKCQQQKKLVFSFWFQFIQRIEHICTNCNCKYVFYAFQYDQQKRAEQVS